MSSLRNAAKRVTHKERAQPANRKKFGLLEKHKDYVERARDFQKKQKFIKNLRSKAENRNPDEFYFNMNKSQVINGVHKKIRKGSIDTDEIFLLKSQDLGYVQHKKTIDEKKIEKLRSNLHLIGVETEAGKKRNHKVFVGTEDEVEKFSPSLHFETDERLVERAYNRPRLAALSESILSSMGTSSNNQNAKMGTSSVLSSSIQKAAQDLSSSHASTLTAKHRKKLLEKSNKYYTELQAREGRVKSLSRAVENLQTQKVIHRYIDCIPVDLINNLQIFIF